MAISTALYVTRAQTHSRASKLSSMAFVRFFFCLLAMLQASQLYKLFWRSLYYSVSRISLIHKSVDFCHDLCLSLPPHTAHTKVKLFFWAIFMISVELTTTLFLSLCFTIEWLSQSLSRYLTPRYHPLNFSN